jgi:heptaprenyl diphosphate synthase
MAAANPLLSDPAFGNLRARVDERLMSAVRSDDPAMDDMASHLIRAGGKRLRPLVAALASVSTSPGTSQDALPKAQQSSPLARVSDDAITGGVAVELVHAGSLHHDDVIDEAVTRHGVDSINARWGNLRAVLSGDYLMARASELAASLGTEVAGLLAATIGRLCEGEVSELSFAYQLDRSEEAYYAAIEGKTAALYAAAARIGGIVAHLPPQDIAALGEFGRLYGLAFQVIDDVLDIVATDEQLGKPAGHDMAEGVYTLPVIITLQGGAAYPGASELSELLGGPLNDQARVRARDLVRESPAVAESVKVADDLVAQAVDQLTGLDSSDDDTRTAPPAVDLLAQLAHALPASLPR